MLVFSWTLQLESSYKHYAIYKSDEALVIAIAIAMSRAIASSVQELELGSHPSLPPQPKALHSPAIS